MLRLAVVLSLSLLLGCNGNLHQPEFTSKDLREGDIIFQTSLSNQSKAVQLATHSKWSHMGMLYKEGENWMVYEASATVKATPLADWIKRGEGGHYVIKRLKNYDSVLDSMNRSRMMTVAQKFKSKKYDLYFEWSDDRIYCSELVWKIYDEGLHIQIGELQKIKDFDLSGPAVKTKMKERYGDNIPTDETVISPVAMFNSPLLKEVESR